MVTDAAGTGFEIKKPHKGTETVGSPALGLSVLYLKLRNPTRGRKPIILLLHQVPLHSHLKLRNPIRGRKQ